MHKRDKFDPHGWLKRARRIASPNHDERPANEAVSLLVIHNISLPPGEFGGPGIVELFTNQLNPNRHPYYAGLQGLRVSSHFLIRRDGQLIQFVSCGARAWHAGASAWRARTRCNDFSVGIELEGSDQQPFAEPQYGELAVLTRELRAQYPIEDVVGHSDIAPGRKTDPGPHFDWVRYRQMM